MEAASSLSTGKEGKLVFVVASTSHVFQRVSITVGAEDEREPRFFPAIFFGGAGGGEIKIAIR